MQAKDLLTNVLSLFLPKDDKKSTQISNDDILGELKLCFTKTIDEQSMKKVQMLYDSDFLILIHPDDYNRREQTLPFVVKNAINTFYEIIANRKPEFGDKPFVPPTDSWYFQFSPTEQFLETKIEKGDLSIISTFASARTNAGIKSGGRVTVTMKPKLSIVYESLNISTDALGGIEYVGKGAFSWPFDKNLGEVTELPRADADGFAVLEYTVKQQPLVYQIHDTQIIISKKVLGVSPSVNTLAIESDFLEENHARIKLDQNSKRFYLAAFADAKIDERTVPLSRGEDIHWVELKPKSTLLLGLFSIKFKSQLPQ
jgi:hypothetical protein